VRAVVLYESVSLSERAGVTEQLDALHGGQALLRVSACHYVAVGLSNASCAGEKGEPGSYHFEFANNVLPLLTFEEKAGTLGLAGKGEEETSKPRCKKRRVDSARDLLAAPVKIPFSGRISL
jgi:hypothetical protein